MSEAVIPVVLFAYARPAHLARVLECLRENRVPLILSYADGAKGLSDVQAVNATRALLREVDWCEVRLVEREKNLGLGCNVLTGVTEVAERHDAFIVWEDDLICVPGTYDWICAALRHYAEDGRVMSVSGWTHPRVTPVDAGENPYLDARADCWVWGAWARSWKGMAKENALAKMREAANRGVSPAAYGADLPAQAAREESSNIWAVRWLYHHFQHGGLCVRPPWSMVEHIGFDRSATNAAGAVEWANPPLQKAPGLPFRWPESVEHPLCRALWTAANAEPSLAFRVQRKLTRLLRQGAKQLVPQRARVWLRSIGSPKRLLGDYSDWAAARAASGGYDSELILQKVVNATRAVRDGNALWERDTVQFHEPVCHEPLLAALRRAAASENGRLSVLDFGGALGSTWWQHRPWFGDLPELCWSVVEQPAFVAAGIREFTTGNLRFYATIDACFEAERPNVVLLSSVLPYLEKPHAMLADLAGRDCDWIIIDRTGFATRGRDWLTVQHVPAQIYPASYPCWFFDRAKLIEPLLAEWSVVAEWPTFDGAGRGYEYRGLMLKRRRPSLESSAVA